jgi:histidinol dehydrogenase
MDQKIRLLRLNTLSKEMRQQLLQRTESDLKEYLIKTESIIEAVRQEGDEALVRFGKDFDKADVSLGTLKVSDDEFTQAEKGVDQELAEAIRFATESIRIFHQSQMPKAMRLEEVRPGVFCGEKYCPIPSVACYVPRGKGSFPSVLMMTAVPAVVAGVPKICVLTPPGPDGHVDDATLYAAKAVGVTDVYKCGGAQAVAAVAYGTKTVPKFDKIVGPGSPWVVAAKRLLANVIDPGTPAGPSESIVFADSSANGALAALDLIIESEHGPDSSAYLVTDSEDIARAAIDAIPGYWERLGENRRSFSQTVLCGVRGGIVVCDSTQDCIDFINDYAPEHLMLHSREPFSYLSAITNAGEILLGENTPISLGNYVLGPNAVLPTSGAARTLSPLGVLDYLKAIGIGHVTSTAYETLARHTHKLAEYEGFDGHALAVSKLRDKIRKTR